MNFTNTATTQEWLPMPSGISLSTHSSFSKDLLKQFDKRRSLLHFDSISLPKNDINQSDNSMSRRSNSCRTKSSSNHSQIVASLLVDSASISSSSVSIINIDNDLQLEEEEGEDNYDVQERSELDNDVVQYDLTKNDNTTNTTSRRSKSAGNLLRKSSVYLRKKLNQHHSTNIERSNIPHTSTTATLLNSFKKKKKIHKSAQDIFNNANINQPQEQTPHLSKIAINTTINIGSISNNNNNRFNLIDLSNSNHIIQPPVITQYPPKPLKYSPVEPLPDEYQYAGNNDNTVINRNSMNSKRRKTLHRLSLPLLKLTAATQLHHQEKEIYRRRSDSDLLNQQQSVSTTNNGLLHSIGKQWNKLIFTCKKKGTSRKKKVAL